MYDDCCADCPSYCLLRRRHDALATPHKHQPSFSQRHFGKRGSGVETAASRRARPRVGTNLHLVSSPTPLGQSETISESTENPRVRLHVAQVVTYTHVVS